MRLLLIGDVHLSDRPPSVRTDSYAEDILAKLRWCADYANDHDIDAVIQMGDVFHRKQPSRTSHSLVVRAAEAFQRFHGTTWVVPGNHDVTADRVDSLPSQPLGALALSPRIKLADGFIRELGVYAIPYYDDFDVFRDGLSAATGLNTKLIVTHAAIFPPDMHPPYSHMNADEFQTLGIPLAHGHIHDPAPHSFYITQNGGWFCNNGAISRGSLHEETLRRKPKVTVFDDSVRNDCPFTSVDVPHRPAAEVFRLAEVQDKKDAEERLDEFLARVGEVNLTSLSIEAVLADAETKLSPSAMAELRDILQEVQ